jgi:hypothetical protein
VAVTIADAREAQTVDADPVKALQGAARDGLLTYHGFVSGGRYEVEIAGLSLDLPAAEVAGTVERLRAVARLAEAGAGVQLVGLRADGTHVVQVGGERVALAADRVVDWCGGYAAALLGRGGEHVGEDRIGQIAALFEDPSRDDQCRMVILGLMHGRGEENRVSAVKLVEMIGALPDVEKPPAKKTVVDALGFGGYLASDLAEKMIRAFGLRWSVSAGPGACERAEGGALPGPLPEMPSLAGLRRIVSAAGEGWVRYVDTPAPNEARWNRRYRLAVGPQVHVVSAEGLSAWLDGVAAFHGGE